MSSFRSINQSLKYKRFTPSGIKNIGIRKFEFVAKSQFLWLFFWKREKCLQENHENKSNNIPQKYTQSSIWLFFLGI